MTRRDFLIALAGLAATPGAGAAQDADLPLARDLVADAALIRQRTAPLVVLFSLPGCPYCLEVRRSHLHPILRDPAMGAKTLIRQVNVGGSEPLVAFDGAQTTHGGLARSLGIRSAPVVAFWGTRGEDLAEPLTGMLLPDFYAAYLEAAIAEARSRLVAIK